MGVRERGHGASARARRPRLRDHPRSRAPVGRSPRRPRRARCLRAALSGAIDSVVTTDALFAAMVTSSSSDARGGTVRATDTAFDIPEVHRWTVRDGKVVAAHFAIDTPAMLQALGASDDAQGTDTWSASGARGVRRIRPLPRERERVRLCRIDGPPTVRREHVEVEPGRRLSALVWARASPSWCCCTVDRRTRTPGTRLRWPSARRR